jgi:hypothetical protein
MGKLETILRVIASAAGASAAGASVATEAAGASVAAGAAGAAAPPHATSIMLARTNTDSKANKRLFIFLLLQNMLGEFNIPHVRAYKKQQTILVMSASPPFCNIIPK